MYFKVIWDVAASVGEIVPGPGGSVHVASLQFITYNRLPCSCIHLLRPGETQLTYSQATILQEVRNSSIHRLPAYHGNANTGRVVINWFMHTDRTGELRVKGFEGRRLGPVQMTTDTAVRVTRMVIEEQCMSVSYAYVSHCFLFSFSPPLSLPLSIPQSSCYYTISHTDAIPRTLKSHIQVTF